MKITSLLIVYTNMTNKLILLDRAKASGHFKNEFTVSNGCNILEDFRVFINTKRKTAKFCDAVKLGLRIFKDIAP